MNLNLNDTVEVTLTETGAAVSGGCAGDVVTTELWSLMRDFGPAMSMASLPPFVNNEVRRTRSALAWMTPRTKTSATFCEVDR